MTSLTAWIAADKRRATGLYFASDSRRSWEGSSHVKDDCIKVFVAEGTREIFAFAGDATFPPIVLQKLCQLLKSEPQLVNALDDPYQRSAWIFAQIKAEFDVLTNKPDYGFCILHGTRIGAMYGAAFHLYEYSYAKGSDSLEYGVVEINAGDSISFYLDGTENSATLGTRGTGHAIVESFVKKETKKLGNVSKAQFSAFCEAVYSKQDKWSGGPIQLVGVLSIKDSLHFGVVTPYGTFYKASAVIPVNHATIRWRNTEFQDVDVYGSLK